MLKQHRPIWKRPSAKSEIVILAGLEIFVEDGAQKTVCESISSHIRDEELSIKQRVGMGARYPLETLNQNKLSK